VKKKEIGQRLARWGAFIQAHIAYFKPRSFLLLRPAQRLKRNGGAGGGSCCGARRCSPTHPAEMEKHLGFCSGRCVYFPSCSCWVAPPAVNPPPFLPNTQYIPLYGLFAKQQRKNGKKLT